MKKFIVLATIVAMLSFSMLAYASEDEYPTYDQTASAILDQGGAEVQVIVDITNGWSVEFARGAVYLYTEGVDPFDTTTEAVAMGLTLDEEVFKEYMEEAQASDSYKEYAQSFSYTVSHRWSFSNLKHWGRVWTCICRESIRGHCYFSSSEEPLKEIVQVTKSGEAVCFRRCLLLFCRLQRSFQIP